jgi:hypothetical protein
MTGRSPFRKRRSTLECSVIEEEKEEEKNTKKKRNLFHSQAALFSVAGFHTVIGE